MKNKIFIIFLLLITGILSISIFNNYKKNDILNDVHNESLVKKALLTMNLEQTAGEGDFKTVTQSEWPKEGYIFNAELSKCENGSMLSWDNVKKTIIMTGNVSDKCYVYFDKARFDQFCDEKLLSCHVAKLYNGIQGENNIYYHDKSLEKGANDYSYRYAGSNLLTNNYVCFGYDSKDGSCPLDNLYRIIGVFDGQVKLVKSSDITQEYLGSDGSYVSFNEGHGSFYRGDQKSSHWYNWNIANSNIWEDSSLNTQNLNVNYINKLGSWADKIAITSWIIGGNFRDKLEKTSIDSVYKNEILSPANDLKYNAKIGLIYLSDYGYAALPKYWSYVGCKNDELAHDYSEAIEDNWLYLGEGTWFITKISDSNNLSFVMYYFGAFGAGTVLDKNVVRPSFYLKSNIKYISGNGTKKTPYIIE